MVKDADHVVVLDEGRVAEEGTPEALIARGGWFTEFANSGEDEAGSEEDEEEDGDEKQDEE
jgi:ATP-binding cassette subfamily B protein